MGGVGGASRLGRLGGFRSIGGAGRFAGIRSLGGTGRLRRFRSIGGAGRLGGFRGIGGADRLGGFGSIGGFGCFAMFHLDAAGDQTAVILNDGIHLDPGADDSRAITLVDFGFAVNDDSPAGNTPKIGCN